MNPDKKSIFREIADRLPPEQQPKFWEVVAHLEKLPPDDEILRVCQAMGMLTLITQKIPSEVAQERETLRLQCHETVGQFKTLLESEHLRSEAFIQKASSLSKDMNLAGLEVKNAASDVKYALYEGANRFSTEQLSNAVRAKMEDAILKPTEETVRESCRAVQRLKDGVPAFENMAWRLENFNYKNAWYSVSAFCGAISIVIIICISCLIKSGCDSAKTDLEAKYESNSHALEYLNKSGHVMDITVQDGKYCICIDNADSTYMSDQKYGVIVLKP